MAGNVVRLPVIGVMGSHRWEHADRAEGVGRIIAEAGAHLLTGGGPGVMAAAARGFVKTRRRRGLSVGVLPSANDDPRHGARPGYPNSWIELPIATHLPYSGAQGTTIRSRNHINILSAAAVIVLPGGAGTRSEAELCVRYARPTIAFLKDAKELPGLPPEIPITDRREDIEQFVARAVARAE
ncbi:MAG: hypothetical protein Tsb0010_12290 [Parvularculaceae bacterium]